MYFPIAAARQLASIPALPNIPPEKVVALVPSPRKSLFCAVTRNGVAVWAVRPAATLAFLSRTPTSTLEHGENVDAWWSPDGDRIIIKTSESFLVLVSVEYIADDVVCKPATVSAQAQRTFLAGPGEGLSMQGVNLHFEGVVRVDGELISVSPRRTHLFFSTKNPATIQRMPWPSDEEYSDTERAAQLGYDTWTIDEEDFAWMVDSDVHVVNIIYSRIIGSETWITSDGRAYLVQLHEGRHQTVPKSAGGEGTSNTHVDDRDESGWYGTCIHDFETPKWWQKQRYRSPDDEQDTQSRRVWEEPRKATRIAVNTRFSVFAVGTASGQVELTPFPSQENIIPKSHLVSVPNPYNRPSGEVRCLDWSSDGYVLAVAWANGWGVFSVAGRCLASSFNVEYDLDQAKFQDTFMFGVQALFWGPGNFDLFLLSLKPAQTDAQIFVVSFAKSATTGQLSPDNTRYAFLQMDDRFLIYRGADQPDMSVISPEADVWQHIKIPQPYLAQNWPIKYSSLSSDGRLVAIAGRRGLLHYSSASGRWRVFEEEAQAQSFTVRGGMIWFHHVLIVATEASKSYQIRLYSRDMELSDRNILHTEDLTSPVVILSLVDNSLLVYTLDNTLHHFLIIPTTDSIRLHLCGSITFQGIIASPSAVRMLSWMIPTTQKKLGDPVDDLSVATVLMVVGGQLILLRPCKTAGQEVKYDLQVFADRIEFCWIHLRGIEALENSLWAYDAHGIKIWLNALSIESQASQDDSVMSVKESVNIPLDFYPLSVLMDKGIIIGAEHEIATRQNLSFVMFRHTTSSHLFLQHILLHHLETKQVNNAVQFATNYRKLIYFPHALEMLLHTVVEAEAGLPSSQDDDEPKTVLSRVVAFLDHFDASLDVVVGCARKTEVDRWRRLFDIVGNPKSLFEECMAQRKLKTAGSYLLVLHTLEQIDSSSMEVIDLLRCAVEDKDWDLCKELLRFLHSIDDSGDALRHAVAELHLEELGPEKERREGALS